MTESFYFYNDKQRDSSVSVVLNSSNTIMYIHSQLVPSAMSLLHAFILIYTIETLIFNTYGNWRFDSENIKRFAKK